MSDYLWEKEGTPDPEIEQLEMLLTPLGYRGEPPRVSSPVVRRRFGIRAGISTGATFAAMSLVLAIVWFRPHRPEQGGAWPMRVSGDTVVVDGRPATGALALGAWVETGTSSAQLTVPDMGAVVLSPGARARIVEASPMKQQLELERGVLSALITAPPRRFFVQTPSTLAIDLGCAFRLEVDASGRTILQVTQGTVALADRAGHEVSIPAGSEGGAEHARIGTPYATRASSDFRALLLRYDRDPSVLPDLVKAAGPDDEFTLRYLSSVGSPQVRALIAARIASIRVDEGMKASGAQPVDKHEVRNDVRPSSVKPVTSTITVTKTPVVRKTKAPVPTIKLDQHGRPQHRAFRDEHLTE